MRHERRYGSAEEEEQQDSKNAREGYSRRTHRPLTCCRDRSVSSVDSYGLQYSLLAKSLLNRSILVDDAKQSYRLLVNVSTDWLFR